MLDIIRRFELDIREDMIASHKRYQENSKGKK
jgi:hypothetical protein